MENKELGIIFENAGKDANSLVYSVIKRRLHLSDYSKIIKDEILKETGEDNIPDALKNHESAKKIFDGFIEKLPDNYSDGSDEISFIKESINDCDIFYICSEMLDTYDSVSDKKNAEIYFGNQGQNRKSDKNENFIAYVRGPLSNTATEKFAKVLGNSSPYIKDSYNTLFKDAEELENGYAVIPVENTNDGRLNYFRNMADRNELYTVLSCEVEGAEDVTTFDLVSSKLKIFDYEGELYLRFRITFDKLDDMRRLQSILAYCNAVSENVFNISAGESSRENSFDFIYNVTNANLMLIYCLLKFMFPQYVTCGIYNKVD